MAAFHGHISVAETGQPVPNLTVSVFRGKRGDADDLFLGSAVTGPTGAFSIKAPLRSEKAPSIYLEVTPPGDASQHAPEPIFRSDPRPTAPDVSTGLAFRIGQDRLAKAGVLPPSHPNASLAERVRSAATGAGQAERSLGAALSDRVAEERELEAGFSDEFLPRFLNSVIATEGASLGNYPFVVGNAVEAAPAVLARNAIEAGIKRIQREASPRDGPQAGEKPLAQRRTRFFFSDAQLQTLDDATTDGGALPEGEFSEISETVLFGILGLDGQLREDGLPTAVSREDELFSEFLTETREEACAAEFLAEPGPAPPQPNPQEEASGDPATSEDVLTKLSETIKDVRSPRAALTGDEGKEPGLAQAIRDFAIPVGPADEPRIFDFSALEVAFDDVWQTVTDRRLEPLARALYTKTQRVLRDTAFPASELATYKGVRAALTTSRRAVGNAAPGVLARRNDGRGPVNRIDDGLDVVLPDPVDSPPDPPGGPDRDFGIDFEGSFEMELTEKDDGDKMDPDATPEDLADQIDAILREPHAFTAFGADDRSKAINFGLVVGYRHVMTPVTYQVGDLVKSITLAPNESREYTSRTLTTRKRAEKELIKNSSIRQDELSEANRAESEIVRKALAKTNFALSSEGTYNLALSKGKAKTNTARDSQTNSNDVKKSFREAVRKASEELRQERSIDVSFESEDTFETSSKGRIENTNNELTLTYLFFELQRRFRVNETIQKATPVILIAQDVPSPDQITNAFLVRHSWVLRRALLDDGFEAALDYVQGQIVGDRLEVLSLKQTLDSHRSQASKLRTQLVALEEQAGRRYEALLQAVRERLAEEGQEESDGIFSDLGESLFGGGQETGTARLREEAARDAEQRAAAKAKELAVQLQRAVNAMNEATEAFNRANNRYSKMSVEVSRLRLHVKDYILHYMQAIWSHEVEDQRFLRLYRQPVPQFVRQDGQVTVYRRLGEGAGITRVHIAEEDSGVSAENRTAVDFELVPSIDVLPEAFDRPLVEMADLTQLLGFLGNYMIFPMSRPNALTDMMLNPYVDEGLRLLDPDDPGNITRPEFAEYVCALRERLSEDQFNDIREALAKRYRELLLSSEYAGDEIVVPSGALYMEALPGTTPLLESFKLAHRAFDLVGAQEDARRKALENLRLAARLVEGDYDDPETDARYDFFGAPGVVAPNPGGGDSGDGGGGN